MSFKKVILIVMFAPLFLASCSDWIDGRKAKASVVDVSDPQLEALDKMPDVLTDFLSGNAKETDIRQSIETLKLAFVKFRTRFKGSRPDAYSASDMRQFFEKYFIKRTPISTQLSEEFMHLKKALFGGDDEWITGAEVDEVVVLLGYIEEEAVLLEPHMKILLAQETGKVTEAQIEAATGQLQSTLLNLLQHVDLTKSDYSYQNARSLINQLGLFAAGSDHFDIFAGIQNWTPVATGAKVVLFGPVAALRGTQAWIGGTKTIVELADLALRYHYLIDGNKFENASQFDSAVDFADRAISLIENCALMKATGKIPLKDIDDVINMLSDRNAIPLDASASSIIDVFHVIVNNILDPQRRGTKASGNFERVHLTVLRRELNIFRMNQTVINNATKEPHWIGTRTLGHNLSLTSLDDLKAKMSADADEQVALKDAASKFQQLLLKPRPVSFTNKGRLFLTATPEEEYWSWGVLTRANVMYFLTRGLLLGYGDKLNPTLSGMREDGFIRWCNDFYTFGVSIRAFDPRDGNSGSRTFKEASFFTYGGVSAGPRVAIDETYEYISFLISGGMGNASDVRTLMEANHCATNDMDIFGLPTIEDKCFEKNFREHFTELFDNLPGVAKEIGQLKLNSADSPPFAAQKQARWDDFYKSLLVAGRGAQSPKSGLDTSDIRTITMVIHYAESLFVVNDTNRNNVLDEKEIEVGAPRFLDFVKEMLPSPLKSMASDAFTYLVVMGEKPDGVGALAKMQNHFIWEKVGLVAPYTAPRINVFHVFANLAADLAGPITPIQPPASTVTPNGGNSGSAPIPKPRPGTPLPNAPQSAAGN